MQLNSKGRWYNALMVRKKWKIFALAIFLVALLGSILLISHKNRPTASKQDLNTAIQSKSTSLSFFPFYYRPAVAQIGGYHYATGSLVSSPDLLSYQMTNDQNKSIQVTQQAKPENFDVSSYKGRLQLNTATGHAVVGKNDTSTSAAIFGEKTMLFIKSDFVVDDQTIEAMLSAFAIN